MNLLAILGNHSIWAYAGILAAHRQGRGYLPMNPTTPPQRLNDMLQQAATRTIIVPGEGLKALEKLLQRVTDTLTVIRPDAGGFADLPQCFPQHIYITREHALKPLSPPTIKPPKSSSLAYMMFTSGSTGSPKGVPVTFANLAAYVTYIQQHYPSGPGDKVAQPADLTFDLCIHPIFVTWASGACLCPIPALSRMAPAKFILDTKLTIWVSVPSVAMFLNKVKALQPGLFASIRHSFFCGEPLPVATGEAWHAATPHGRLINLYGPTEATVAISAYEWQGSASTQESQNGMVPIGWIFATQQAALLQEDGSLHHQAGEGELCLAGSQVTSGYLQNPEKTAHHYIRTPASGEKLWYRTGDWVKRRQDGCLFFLRRVDNQIKLRGHRIEIQEIEAVIRAKCGHDFAVVIPWPLVAGSVQGLVACIETTEAVQNREILQACRDRLPPYMVPARIEVLAKLPLNHNGKIDRAALIKHLDNTATGER